MMLVTSCSDDNKVPDGFFLQKSLAQVFIMPSDDSNRASANYKLNLRQSSDDNREVYVEFNGTSINEDNDKKLFNKLLDKYNDHFPKPRLIESDAYGDPSGSCVLGEEIRGIEIKSLDDFNAAHRAGADMGDVIVLQWVSYYDYIQAGYDPSAKNGNGPYLTNDPCWDPKATFHGLTGNSSIYPIKVLDLEFYTMPSFFISQKPDIPGEYRFEVKFKFETCEATTIMKVTFS